MLFNHAIMELKNMKGNIVGENENIYISQSNIKIFLNLIKKCSNFESILITPFLINQEKNIYELYYYEFEIEIDSFKKSKYIEYEQGNILVAEIIDNIYPKAIVNAKDKFFYISALSKYILAINSMSFLYDKKLNPSLINSKLYYQIY